MAATPRRGGGRAAKRSRVARLESTAWTVALDSVLDEAEPLLYSDVSSLAQLCTSAPPFCGDPARVAHHVRLREGRLSRPRG